MSQGKCVPCCLLTCVSFGIGGKAACDPFGLSGLLGPAGRLPCTPFTAPFFRRLLQRSLGQEESRWRRADGASQSLLHTAVLEEWVPGKTKRAGGRSCPLPALAALLTEVRLPSGRKTPSCSFFLQNSFQHLNLTLLPSPEPPSHRSTLLPWRSLQAKWTKCLNAP